eukprot:ANDGO_01226.mRNA.1 hypothetical protein
MFPSTSGLEPEHTAASQLSVPRSLRKRVLASVHGSTTCPLATSARPEEHTKPQLVMAPLNLNGVLGVFSQNTSRSSDANTTRRPTCVLAPGEQASASRSGTCSALSTYRSVGGVRTARSAHDSGDPLVWRPGTMSAREYILSRMHRADSNSCTTRKRNRDFVPFNAVPAGTFRQSIESQMASQHAVVSHPVEDEAFLPNSSPESVSVNAGRSNAAAAKSGTTTGGSSKSQLPALRPGCTMPKTAEPPDYASVSSALPLLPNRSTSPLTVSVSPSSTKSSRRSTRIPRRTVVFEDGVLCVRECVIFR